MSSLFDDLKRTIKRLSGSQSSSSQDPAPSDEPQQPAETSGPTADDSDPELPQQPSGLGTDIPIESGPPEPPDEADGVRTVYCAKLKRRLPGLESPPFPGELGQRIYENVSQQAYQMWIEQSTIIINHYGLSLGDPDARAFLQEQMEVFLFEDEEEHRPEGWIGEDEDAAGPPPVPGPQGKGGGAPGPQGKGGGAPGPQGKGGGAPGPMGKA